MKRLVLLINIFCLAFFCQAQAPEDNIKIKKGFIQLNSPLYYDVEMSGVFKDSKLFPDAVPKYPPAVINKLYDSLRTLPDFDLRDFVYSRFALPDSFERKNPENKGLSMDEHIRILWSYLERPADKAAEGSTLLPLKYPYIVPGGRFREVYYWDSFFTMLGLLADGKEETAGNMIKNFAYLIDNYGFIPNGNRVYYLTRSQPPFFALMIDLMCRYKNDYNWGIRFLPELKKEYSFWMNSNQKPDEHRRADRHVVAVDRENVLNRYFDMDSVPREESYREDRLLSEKIDNNLRSRFFRDIRSAAESGWDFSSRWFRDSKNLTTIETTAILPVDLNCLLYFLEDRLALFCRLNGESKEAANYVEKAAKRKELINKYFWNNEKGYYFDFNWEAKKQKAVFSMAGIYPLYFGIASPAQARRAVRNLSAKLLCPGGLTATEILTSQQWDSPNGWPPLQWMAVKALREYGFNKLADTIKSRWLKVNLAVFNRTGRMVEKYNVKDLSLFAGGGEYKLQDGFGWTNGVAEALLNDFDKKYIFKSAENKK
ncbi:MAG: alpha,alpha-trehalase TreF [Syntrophothermus sp.]